MSKKPTARDYRITFEPMGVSCRGKDGESLFEIASHQNISLRSDCGGQGRCGKCLVAANPADHLSPITENESKVLNPEHLSRGYRLACQAKLKGPVRAFVAESMRDAGDAFGKTDIRGEFSFDPPVKRLFVSIPPPTMSKNQTPPDFAAHVSESCGRNLVFDDPAAIRALGRPAVYRGEMTLVSHDDKGITAVFEGRRERSLGVALDIGTTTLAAYVCNLNAGTIVTSAASANSQRRFGEDVISRIAFINRQEHGLSILQETLVEELRALIGKCLKDIRAEKTDIDEVTVVGNTSMVQIFMGVHPHGLGISPYLPVSRKPKNLRADDIGLDLNPGTNVYVFPVISGFVGADTVSVILSEGPHEKEAVSLIVDIGTNGEVVLGNREGLWATSCATGPAFEGAHIACGMRAAAGAIHRVKIDPKSCRARYEILGNDEKMLPRGICGSGIIDAAAGMLRSGLILPNGRIQEGLPGVVADEKQIGRKFILVPSVKSATGREIVVTLSDVRQIQLAKAALFVGIKLLLRQAGLAHFERLVLTGAFGARFDWKNAVAIGMLPEMSRHTEVKIVGNAAGRGAVKALLDRKLRTEVQTIAEKVRYIELAEDPDFAVEFPAATMFPSAIRLR